MIIPISIAVCLICIFGTSVSLFAKTVATIDNGRSVASQRLGSLREIAPMDATPPPSAFKIVSRLTLAAMLIVLCIFGLLAIL